MPGKRLGKYSGKNPGIILKKIRERKIRTEAKKKPLQAVSKLKPFLQLDNEQR
jgi:hypothetical protein